MHFWDTVLGFPSQSIVECLFGTHFMDLHSLTVVVFDIQPPRIIFGWNPPPLDSQPNIIHGGCMSNTTTVNECRSIKCVPKRHSTIDWDGNPRTVSQKCTQVINLKNSLIWLNWGVNPGLVSQKCI